MRIPAASLLAAAACIVLPACSKEEPIRRDEPAHLVEDLARSLIKPARNWLNEEQSREEDLTLGHPSSAEISTHAINFMRLVDHARGRLEPHLPAETRGMPVPSDLSNAFRIMAASLAAAAPGEVSAAEDARTPNSARVRLTIAPAGLDARSWILSLEREAKVWQFTAAPRRG